MTTAVSTLAEFLLARIAEDEKVALRITPGRNPRNGQWRADSLEFSGVHDRETTSHIVRHDPARVLAECEAKRQIVEAYQQTQTSEFVADAGYQVAGGAVHAFRVVLHTLALPYAAHPDYRPEWRP